MAIIKYPKEIKPAYIIKEGNKFKTLSIENNLSVVSEEPDAGDDYIRSPLEIFSPYSVFRATIIEKNGTDNKQPYANIPVCDVAGISEFTKLAMQKTLYNNMERSILNKLGKKNGEEDEYKHLKVLAYGTQLLVGKFRGKSPAQLIIESEENIIKLKETKKWLEDRNNKNNAAQIEAIKAALVLYDNKLLSKEDHEVNSTASEPFVIYDKPIKTLKSTTRSDGKCLVYGINISYRYDSKNNNANPIHIRITNYYAKTKNVVVIPETIDENSVQEVSIAVDEYTWCDYVKRMERIIDIYYHTYGSYELKRSFDYLKQINSK